MKIRKIIGISILILSVILILNYTKIPTAFVIWDNPLAKQSYYLLALSALFAVGLILTVIKSKEQSLEEKLDDVQTFETSRGSKYDVLTDGRTQRYKTATQDQRSPHKATVFIPDFETLRKAIPAKDFRSDLFGDDKEDYEEKLGQLIYKKGYKSHIIDQNGNILEDQGSIKMAGKRLFLTLEREGKIEAYIPVSQVPRKDYYVYQTTKEKGERRTHLGHPVTKIAYKDGRIIS